MLFHHHTTPQSMSHNLFGVAQALPIYRDADTHGRTPTYVSFCRVADVRVVVLLMNPLPPLR